MTEFTPYSALLGGMMIGFSALFLLILFGKIAGISGMLGNLLSKPLSHAWVWSFLGGMILAGFIFSGTLNEVESINLDLLSWRYVLLGGFVVGIGTSLGSGCTSGHGICGIGRFSVRSLIATCLFMLTAIITVYVRG
ncbi:YeeE/YedE family protein [Algibacillus agarilyticus]|uniref:YeeE/YedE family protein n=1 Tax=Algibacillus agarilyticus TaxID=2234133 RepID=UPI000DD03E36|nr:YeeE/YedE family protein [Algibacillus agarilyticus]